MKNSKIKLPKNVRSKTLKIRKYLFSIILIMLINPSQSINDISFDFKKIIIEENDTQESLYFSNINDNSYTIDNTFNKTVKFKISDPICGERIFFVLPKKSLTISYKSLPLSRYIINSTFISVYYDLECYNNDLKILNDVASQRLRDEQIRQFVNTLLRIAGDRLKTSDNEKMRNIGKGLKGLADYSDIKKEYDKGGLSPEFQKKLIKSLSNIFSDQNSKIEAISNYLQTLHDYANSSLEIKTKDLEDAAFFLCHSIGETEVNNFNMNYSAIIAPVIDYDVDDILNSNDDCPRIMGLAKYNGCTKEIYKAKKRKERNSIVKSFWIDFGYSYSNYGKINFHPGDFQTKLTKNAFYLNTTVPVFKHKFSNNLFGAFGIEANYLVGNIITPDIKITKTNTETGKVNDEITDKLKIKEHSIFAGLSYNLLIKTKGGATIFQPEFGTLLYSSQIDKAYNISKYYVGLTMRLDYSIGGWFFGVKYQQNQTYSINFHNYSFFLPDHNLNYYLGLYYRF